jgi:hypothetical protein
VMAHVCRPCRSIVERGAKKQKHAEQRRYQQARTTQLAK